MLELDIIKLHCYRCGNTWTPRSRVVRICARCKSPYWEAPRLRIPTGGGGLGVEQVLRPHKRRIEEIARRYGAREIRVFGSLARGAANAESDVDLLVDFDRSRTTDSTLRSLDFAMELETLLGRRVDVATEDSLHWFAQPQIIAEAVPL